MSSRSGLPTGDRHPFVLGRGTGRTGVLLHFVFTTHGDAERGGQRRVPIGGGYQCPVWVKTGNCQCRQGCPLYLLYLQKQSKRSVCTACERPTTAFAQLR